VALGLTAFVFTTAIRGKPHPGQSHSGWLVPMDFFLHGWPLISVNLFFYGWICWIGFWCIRGASGRECAFMVGWLTGIFLWPIRMLRPEWALALKHISAFGLGVAFLAALALLLEPSDVADSTGRTGAT